MDTLDNIIAVGLLEQWLNSGELAPRAGRHESPEVAAAVEPIARSLLDVARADTTSRWFNVVRGEPSMVGSSKVKTPVTMVFTNRLDKPELESLKGSAYPEHARIFGPNGSLSLIRLTLRVGTNLNYRGEKCAELRLVVPHWTQAHKARAGQHYACIELDNWGYLCGYRSFPAPDAHKHAAYMLGVDSEPPYLSSDFSVEESLGFPGANEYFRGIALPRLSEYLNWLTKFGNRR